MATSTRRRRSTAKGNAPEKEIQNAMVSFLARGKLTHNRVNNGQFQMSSEKASGATKKRRIRCNSLEGISDLEIFTYMENEFGTRIQIMIYMEVKTEVGKQSETQMGFENVIDGLGGLYFIVTSVKELYNALLVSKDYVERAVPGFKLYIGRAKA